MTTKELSTEKKEAEVKDRTTPEKFYLPATDILEHEDKLVLFMDMPGMRKEDININVEEHTLKVETAFNPDRYAGLTPLYSEYNVGPFTRSFTLSTKIDRQRIEAKMEQGVLEIVLPKRAELVRQISIQ